MSIYREFHYRPRSLAQVSFSREKEESALDASLRLTRAVSRILNPLLYRFRIGIDFSKTLNLRADTNEVTLFVRTPAQKQRLSQLIPRLENELHQKGLTQSIVIRVRPTTETVSLRENNATGTPREASCNASEITSKTAQTIDDLELRAELLKLARVLHQ